MHFLLPINKVLHRLQQKYGAEIVIVTSSDYERLSQWALRQFCFRHTFVEWNLDTVSSTLASCDVGIAPLPHDSYMSSNKIVSYWAVGLPVVASPTTEYRKVISHGENGLLAGKTSEWESCLSSILLDIDLQRRLGSSGREYATQHFRVEKIAEVWEGVLVEVFRESEKRS